MKKKFKSNKITKKGSLKPAKEAAMQKLAAFQQMMDQANPSNQMPGQNYKGNSFNGGMGM
ncbi:MAG: hypothetical protein EB127_03460 [Alphaproteobacteria bacterium]|nr:hypothetical protein [Alphaproteobacteria bacterium]